MSVALAGSQLARGSASSAAPRIDYIGWDCCQAGKTSLYAAVYHATAARWRITDFQTVKMHHGWDHPACYPGFSCGTPEPKGPGLSDWIGSSRDSRLRNHMLSQNWTAIVRLWDHRAFSKYRVRHHCDASGNCSMTMTLVRSRG